MKIGVVILAYNLERFLADAIDSVLAQTLVPARIVAVDDGSSDRTAAVIRRYQPRGECIRHKQNVGALPAHISGIEALHGSVDVLAFLDGDDIWEPNKLEEMQEIFQRDENVIFASHNFSIIDASGTDHAWSNETHVNLRHVTSITDRAERSDYIRSSILSYRGIWLGSAFCIRSNALDLARYIEWVFGFPGRHLSYQDHPLATFLIKERPDALFEYCDKKLFRYRVFGENTSGISSSPKDALNTVRRSIATIVRTRSLVKAMGPDRIAELRRQDAILLGLIFIRALYRRQNLLAARRLSKILLADLDVRSKMKEIGRFLGCVTLGVERFLASK